jgi:hypothetical protein
MGILLVLAWRAPAGALLMSIGSSIRLLQADALITMVEVNTPREEIVLENHARSCCSDGHLKVLTADFYQMMGGDLAAAGDQARSAQFVFCHWPKRQGISPPAFIWTHAL